MSPVPFHLLELNVISAQDLSSMYKNMRTYAITWIHPGRKLRTRIDQQGQINPTWNDKFVFRVDERFLDSETSSVMIEIYATGWFRDVLVGSVRVLICNLLPQNVRNQKDSSKRRFVALQIRRPSGRPQGILNMGVTLLDNNMKTMPLYAELAASAVGLGDLTDAKLLKPHGQETSNNNKPGGNNTKEGDENAKIKKTLRRTQSDCTDVKGGKEEEEENLLMSCKAGDLHPGGGNGSVVNGSYVGGSIVYGSEVGGKQNGSMCNSDVGPSASIVAAAVARGLYPTPLAKPHKPGSSILADWTAYDSNTEGLKSKIERWRMELPGSYDTSSTLSNHQTNGKSKDRKYHGRRHSSDNRDGAFSCFGTICGCEFTIVCGSDSGSSKKDRARTRNSKLSGSEVDSPLVG